ncbi:MAG: hypothetical protein SXA11_15690 [Cyanobacteriota bacterium]|nr:hypothetical protein [Cyanobacteriota bacterium]
MFNFLDSEAIGLGQTSTDPVMAAINGSELVNGLPSATDFGAENSYINVEDFPIVYGPTTSELMGGPTDGEIDILTGNEEETATRIASATNPNAEEVHRFWDEQTESHFFTADEEEFEESFENSARYEYEGVEFEAPLSSVSGAKPVYRFENQITKTYFYTLQSPEAITNNFPDLQRDGIAFYAFPPNEDTPSGTVPVHRFFNGTTSAQTGTPVHFYTGTEENKDNVIENLPTYVYEGPGWYAYQLQGSSTSTSEEPNTSALPPSPETSNATANPGNTLDTALDISATTTRSGSTDSYDYYRFTIPDNGIINIAVNNVTRPTKFHLIKDFNENGIVDGNNVFDVKKGVWVDWNEYLKGTETSISSGESFGISTEIEAESGPYFVAVRSTNIGENTDYELRLNFSPKPSNTARDPGNDLDKAFNIGELETGTLRFTEFVGISDTDDFYRFEISQESEVNITLGDTNNPTKVSLVKDDNNNGIFDEGRETLPNTVISDGKSQRKSLEAGTYFVRVYPSNRGGNANYDLTIAI